MKNKHGFTLVEILLAVMIVGLIGVALAAVTTAALRESGIGRTRMILRNQVSIALRQFRQDVQLADSVAVNTESGKRNIVLTFGAGNKPGPNPGNLPSSIEYSFTAGAVPAPGNAGATIGGTIYRTVENGTAEVWLANVKQIDIYPSFSLVGQGAGNSANEESAVRIRFIVQSNALPVVNDFIDETFVTSHGVGVCDPCLSLPAGISCGTTCE